MRAPFLRGLSCAAFTVLLAVVGVRAAFAATPTTLSLLRGFDGGPAITGATLGWYRASDPAISDDGRFCAFASNALNFAPDANGLHQVYVRDLSTGQMELISRAADGTPANGGCGNPVLSADGRYVAYSSSATNLDPSTLHTGHVWLFDRVTRSTERIDLPADGSDVNDWSGGRIRLSGNGRFVLFHSAASNLVRGDTNGWPDLFLRDRVAGITERVNVSTSGAQSPTPQYDYGWDLSNDGRWVIFASHSSTLVDGDTNGESDVFLRDRQQHTTQRVSIQNGTQLSVDSSDPRISGDGIWATFTIQTQVWVVSLADGSMERVGPTSAGTTLEYEPDISTDGRYVVYTTGYAYSPADTNGLRDTYLFDRLTRLTERVSVGTGAIEGDRNSPELLSTPQVSADGRMVAFLSDATNFVPGDTYGKTDLFIRDRSLAVTICADAMPTGTLGVAPATCSGAAITPDGRYIVFDSDAMNLVPGDTNGGTDTFVLDRRSGAVERVSVTSEGGQAEHKEDRGFWDGAPAISGDGRFVVFVSRADNLAPKDDTWPDVFLRDRLLGTTRRVTTTPSGYWAGGHGPSISEDGRWVALDAAQALVPGDRDYTGGIHVYDRMTGTYERISSGWGGTAGGSGDFYSPALVSGDGRYVAFAHSGERIVSGDTNGVTDVFVRDRTSGLTRRVSVSSSGGQASGASALQSLTADGRYVGFYSYATDLVPGGGTWGYADSFVHDRADHTTVRVSLTHTGAASNQGGWGPALSEDGRWAAFHSWDDGFVGADSNGGQDVFLRNRKVGVTTRASVGSAGDQMPGDSTLGAVTANARFILFLNNGRGVIPSGGASSAGLYLRDLGSAGGPPAAPSSLVATSLSSSAIRLDWHDGSKNEGLFRIERSDDGGATFSPAGAAGANITSWTDWGLATGVYVYRIRSANEDGGSAGYAEVWARTTGAPPLAPTGLRVYPVTENSITLRWRDPNSGEAAYRVERAGADGQYQVVTTTALGSTSYRDSGLSESTTYSYRVTATGSAGDAGPAGPIAATTLPAAPTNLSAAVSGPQRITLRWLDHSSGESEFRIERSTDGGATWPTVLRLSSVVGSGSWVTYLDGGLTPGLTYTYRVSAIGPGGASSPAGPVAVLLAVPAAPGNLTAAALSPTRIRLSWTENAANRTYFEVQWSTDGGVTYPNAARVTGSYALGATVTYDRTGLTPAAAYTFRVRAVNGAGGSAFAGPVSATTQSVPAPPADLRLARVSSTQLKLTWTDQAQNEQQFQVERSTDGGSTFTLRARRAAVAGTGGTTFYTDSGLTPGTTYIYRVRAWSDGAGSEWAGPVSGTP
jgi:Tol biopolymer transport system component